MWIFMSPLSDLAPSPSVPPSPCMGRPPGCPSTRGAISERSPPPCRRRPVENPEDEYEERIHFWLNEQFQPKMNSLLVFIIIGRFRNSFSSAVEFRPWFWQGEFSFHTSRAGLPVATVAIWIPWFWYRMAWVTKSHKSGVLDVANRGLISLPFVLILTNISRKIESSEKFFK